MIPLDLQEVLVLDCQTTGASPKQGHLLELGWCRANASTDQPRIKAFLVKLPPGERIPRRVSQLTGIREQDMTAAVSGQEVWRRLLQDVKGADRQRPYPTVVHFVRFERPFVETLHRANPQDPFPLDWICTHEIARRLFPSLPRRSLRALSGYFGAVMERPHKRSTAHVLATIAIWRNLVQHLQDDHGVSTLEELRRWLVEVSPEDPGQRDFPLPRIKRLELPEAPGVYRLQGRGGQVLYLGKATSLRRRVNSHYYRRPGQPERSLEMLTQAWDVEFTITETPLEAALLEADEIKRCKPPYNVALRERDQGIWFASLDLVRIARAAAPRQPIGPIPGRVILDAAREIRELSKSECDSWSDNDRRRALGLPEGIRVPSDAFEEGFTSFVIQHKLQPGGDPLAPLLLRLGARLWRDRREVAAEETLEGEQEAGEVRRAWTPQRVAAALEGVVLRFAHLVRRAHWLCQICEATLAWQRAGDERGARRMLVIEGGKVVRSEEVPLGTNPPPPPGSGRTLQQRWGCFDSSTYDRLRVLTSELRRVVAVSRSVEVILGPRQVLDRGALARRLLWI